MSQIRAERRSEAEQATGSQGTAPDASDATLGAANGLLAAGASGCPEWISGDGSVRLMLGDAIVWQCCYDDSWNGLIVPEAFSHPAKFARGLIRRIYQHALASSYLKPGDVVVDPFGGVALGALDAMQAGVRWFGCELEQRFVDLGNANLTKWRRAGLDGGVLVQGDSRQLCAVLGPLLADCVLGSPPYEPDVIRRRDAGNHEPNKQGSMRSGQHSCDEYGSTPGQLGGMRAGDVSAVIGSPPFSGGCEGVMRADKFKDPVEFAEQQKDKGHGCSLEAKMAQMQRENDRADYGATEGQLGSMPTGSVDSIISSPPYSGNEKHDYRTDEARYRGKSQGMGCFNGSETYGESAENLGNLPTGSVDAVVSSPPYTKDALGHAGGEGPRTTNAPHSKKGTVNSQSYGQSPGNLGNLPAGDVAAIVSSPPYADQATNGARANREANLEAAGIDSAAWMGKRRCTQGRSDGYGTAEGQLAALPPGDVADCLISSPPFYDCQNSQKEANNRQVITSGTPTHAKDAVIGRTEYTDRKKQLHNEHAYMSPEWIEDRKRQAQQEANIAKLPPEAKDPEYPTFWSAAKEIVSQCYQILRPNGVAIFVCKDFVRKGQRVPFSADWQKLCVACGFEPVEWIKASLVKETRHPGLFGEAVTKKKERKGFFRRLAEKKGSPPIDHEDVLIVRKPPQPRQLELIP